MPRKKKAVKRKVKAVKLVGDGVADDTAAVQQAWDSGTKLPPGEYRISETIQVATTPESPEQTELEALKKASLEWPEIAVVEAKIDPKSLENPILVTPPEPPPQSFSEFKEQLRKEIWAMETPKAVVPPVAKVMPEINLACIAYIPPNKPKLNRSAFLKNLAANPPASDLVLFGEGVTTATDIPEGLGTRIDIKNPENVIRNTAEKPYIIANIIFLTALRILTVNLKAAGYTHALVVESDCRMRNTPEQTFDQRMIAEFLSLSPLPLVAGSVAVYDPDAQGAEGIARHAELTKANTRRAFPVVTYKSKGEPAPCVFAYGAGGIYDIAALLELFPVINTIKTAQEMVAWDVEIGRRIYLKHGAKSYDLVRHLNSLHSSFGEQITTFAERAAMLRSGEKCLVHQWKSGEPV